MYHFVQHRKHNLYHSIASRYMIADCHRTNNNA